MIYLVHYFHADTEIVRTVTADDVDGAIEQVLLAELDGVDIRSVEPIEGGGRS